MKGKISVLAVGLVVAVLAILYMSISEIFAARQVEAPSAVGGWLDLRDYPLTGGKAVRLDGEWQFIPGKLVPPDQMDSSSGEAMLVHVPSSWTAYEVDGKPFTPYSSATYRLRILLNEADSALAVKTTNVRLANRLFVNGQLIKQSGEPREDASYAAYTLPYVKNFHADRPVVDIVLHVANFHLAMGGGIINSIYFGDEESVRGVSQSTTAYDWIMVAVFLTIGIFGLGYYWQIGRDRPLVMFAVFCFFVALYRMTHGERLFSALLPALPYEWFQKLQYLSSAGIGIFLLLFYHLTLRDVSNRHVIRLSVGVGVALALALLLPAHINSRLDSLFGWYALFAFVYIAYLSFSAVLKRSVGYVYIALSCVSLLALFVIEHLDLYGGSAGFTHLHVLPFVYLISIVLYLSRQFADNYLKKEQLNRQLLQHDRLKDEFLAKTSHEFRTPLHGIISIAQSMLDSREQQPTDAHKEKLQLIAGVSRRLSGLVNDILLHAKLREGEYALESRPFELQPTVQLAAAFCSHLTYRSVVIEHHAPDRPCRVLGDEERVRQILYNLIGNAARFTRQGRIDIRYETKDNFVYVSVADTGEGIAPEKLGSIFEPFWQDNAHASGAGLGLSIVKQLVELQGGKLSATSEPGVGSTFTFGLPAAEPEREPATSGGKGGSDGAHSGASRREARPAEPEAPPLPLPLLQTPLALDSPGRPRILLVDDDHLNLNMLMDMLAAENYGIVAVDSGAQALELLERDRSFALVLLDIMMPEMSGYEVCGAIRQSFSLVELPVLMLTAAILPEDIVAAFQSGANDFLHKPLDASELKTRVRNLIMMKAAAAKATEMEVSFLQAQIKPHFIYNTLNSVISLSYSDPERSRKLLMNFSAFLRGSFVFKTVSNRVPLHQELSLVQAYVEIEMARYPGLFRFELETDESAGSMIPPLIIQPLVENAIRHGAIRTLTRCAIEVRVTGDSSGLTIAISDTGSGIEPDKLAELRSQSQGAGVGVGVGLPNIMKRVRQIAGASLDIRSEVGAGTHVTIRLPHFDIAASTKQEASHAEGRNR